jgi:hypothetical protein
VFSRYAATETLIGKTLNHRAGVNKSPPYDACPREVAQTKLSSRASKKITLSEEKYARDWIAVKIEQVDARNFQ